MNKNQKIKNTNAKIKAKRKQRALLQSLLILFLICIILFVILFDLYIYPINKIWLKFSTPLYLVKPEDALRIHFIDVGQGDSTIIEFPDNKNMIIDGGNDTLQVQNTVLKYTTSLGIEKFDYLIATHSDTDHVGALDAVLETYGSKAIYMPYIETAHQNAAFQSFYTMAQKSKAEVYTTQMTQSFVSSNDNFYYMLCLSPTGPDDKNSFYYAGESNNTSAVFYLEYANRNILLTGDASSKVEKYFIDLYKKGIYNNIIEYPTENGSITLTPRLENITFYKVGHHGSSSSSSDALLQVIRPQESFISCGVGNSYGHPSVKTLERLNQFTKKIHRTDISRNIVLTIYKNGNYTVEYH